MNPEINIQPLREVSLPYGNLRSQLLDGAILFRGNIMEEVWKPIKDYEGLYEVSNLGRVKRLKYQRVVVCNKNRCLATYKEKIRKPSLVGTGYYGLLLRMTGKKPKCARIHQLVWDAFGDKPRDGHKLQIDHIDGNKTNNHIDNLQLLTCRSNVSKFYKQHGRKYNLPTGVCKSRNKFRADCRIKNKNVFIGVYDTAEEASFAYKQKIKEIDSHQKYLELN